MTIYIGGDGVGDGQESVVSFLTDTQEIFIYGLDIMIKNIFAHVVGTFNVWEEFTRLAFISGINTSQNNEDPTWGPVLDLDAGISNVYNPKLAYVNGLLGTLTGTKTAYIPSYGVILRSPTLDGQLDQNAVIVDDICTVNNDGFASNSPTWIAGPH